MNQLLSILSNCQKAKFASLTYRSKGTQELARHTILLGASYEKAKEKDLQKLLILQPRLSGIELQACEELIESLKKPVGQNDAYTCKDVYEDIGIKGIKKHKETSELHLLGYAISKLSIEKGIEKKPVKSSEKTIAKDKLRKLGRLSKIRQFCLSLENLKSVKVNGKTIEFD